MKDKKAIIKKKSVREFSEAVMALGKEYDMEFVFATKNSEQIASSQRGNVISTAALAFYINGMVTKGIEDEVEVEED